MNRRAAVGALNDKTNHESSGKAEWQSRTKPNISFNRSANGAAFMRETMLIIMARRARLMRALDLFRFWE
jgi:hypothetical protein